MDLRLILGNQLNVAVRFVSKNRFKVRKPNFNVYSSSHSKEIFKFDPDTQFDYQSSY